MKNIIEETYTTQETLQLREQFITEYCISKGWNQFNLTNNQLVEIRNQDNWKNPKSFNTSIIKS